ncbi:MAG: hypothetical protein HQL64_10610 [Magnetococcales bacterium]|nr:hypothetical protein [Magnetococcales bacterium]
MGVNTVKFKHAAIALVGSMLLSGMAYAGADDMKWISKCLNDNADAKVAPDVVSKYCTCMNDKMSEGETQSITQWEKSHPQERTACEKAAGWN